MRGRWESGMRLRLASILGMAFLGLWRLLGGGIKKVGRFWIFLGIRI
jgi:hypothetical protein